MAETEILEIPENIYQQMIRHAEEGLPYEACGLFAANSPPKANTPQPGATQPTSQQVAISHPPGAQQQSAPTHSAVQQVAVQQVAVQQVAVQQVAKFYPMTNVAASQMIYQLDGLENIEVERQAEESGLEIIGVMHSHTQTPAYPSPTDVQDATNFDPFGSMHFVIVSLQYETPSLRSFRIREGEITEEAVKLNGAS